MCTVLRSVSMYKFGDIQALILVCRTRPRLWWPMILTGSSNGAYLESTSSKSKLPRWRELEPIVLLLLTVAFVAEVVAAVALLVKDQRRRTADGCLFIVKLMLKLKISYIIFD